MINLLFVRLIEKQLAALAWLVRVFHTSRRDVSGLWLGCLVNTFLAVTALFCGSSMSRADPIMSVDLVQTGANCVLNWGVLDCPEQNGGAALFVDGLFLGNKTGNFLGWWSASSGIVAGTVSSGWTDFPPGGIDDGTSYVPFPNARFAGIFSPGVHSVYISLYTDPARHPTSFTPDGPLNGGPHLRLVGNITVAPVPDGGSTLLLMGLAAGIVFAFGNLGGRARAKV